MRLMHYNVLFDSIKLELLQQIVEQAQPDILTLNEVQPPELELLQKLGYHTLFAETKKEGKHYGNGMAWNKRFTPQSIQTVVQDLKTPLILWETELFSVYVTHLAAKEGEVVRFQEIQRIFQCLPPLHSSPRDFFLTGDLNTLSPHDGYDLKELEKGMHRHGHTKFGIPVSMKVIPYLEEQGLVDVLQKAQAAFPTAPTSEGTPDHEKAQHFQPLRLDYIFATPTLAAKATKAYVLRSSAAEKCSDHYPIVAELNV